jgi:hypothetical protein
MRFIWALTIFTIFSTSALAQDNKIVVINEDGTSASVEITPPSILRRGAVPAPRPMPTPASQPEEKPAKAQPKAELKNLEKNSDETVKKVEPAKKPAVPQKKAVTKTSEKKPVKKPAKTPAKSTKPVAEKIPAAPKAPVASAPLVPTRLGPAMTSEDAIRIAIDAAPPAKSVFASPVNFKGLHAYEVVFKTDEGDQFIYVDRETGRIVK